MQNDRTLKFWDDYHAKECNKEWILHPTNDLLRVIYSHFPKKNCNDTGTLRILEIGCGTSTMARDLWQHIKQEEENWKVEMCATDVSPICIGVNQERDALILAESDKRAQECPPCSTLRYRVLNVLDEEPDEKLDADVILDKGCLDTFMFRSRNRGENHAYANLLEQVLDNVWRWMSDEGVYLLISPRRKLRAVRDYAGFSSVKKYPLKSITKAALVRNNHNKKDGKPESNNPGYIYVCKKNMEYVVGETPAFAAMDYRVLPEDNIRCPHCGISFLELRKGEAVEGRGTVYWTRQWKGHCLHCKVPHKQKWS